VKMFDAGKTRMIGLPYGEKNFDDRLSRFHLIPGGYGRTDRRTDRQICYINIARPYADARIKLFPQILLNGVLKVNILQNNM